MKIFMPVLLGALRALHTHATRVRGGVRLRSKHLQQLERIVDK
jgi:hypothetical protein